MDYALAAKDLLNGKELIKAIEFNDNNIFFYTRSNGSRKDKKFFNQLSEYLIDGTSGIRDKKSFYFDFHDNRIFIIKLTFNFDSDKNKAAEKWKRLRECI